MSSPLTTRLLSLRNNFDSGITRSCTFRKEQLKKLKHAILQYEKELYAALHKDLGKSAEESWVTELGMVISEINTAIKNLQYWMHPKKVKTNLVNMPSSSRIMHEPLGVVLIMAPWNYPFQLLINPLVGAMAAGNCVVLKASESAAATEAVMKKMIEAVFPENYIMFVQGNGAEVIPPMMNHFTFNHVFYTGSTAVGKIIYQMAAERLVPVTLELGGKSPCVVEADANIKVTAKRIAITRFSNAGQMCVAPDYILVHDSVKDQLVSEIKNNLKLFFGEKPEDNYNYCHIINEKQFDRLVAYLKEGDIAAGGRYDRDKLFIEPTILENVSTGSQVMNDEIFGPILPVLTFKTMAEAKAVINLHPEPLSFYVYTSSGKKATEWLEAVPAGGCCVNNSSWHLTNHHLPFGGRGTSGFGRYHGLYSFETFSHKKAVMKTPTWLDPGIKYPPFKGKLKIFKTVIR